MALVNPNRATEILYGTSGDVRNEINAFASISQAGHYVDEREIPGSSIIAGLQKATRIINGYLEVVYADQIPVETVNDVPLLLDEIANDLATYYAWRSNAARLMPISDEKRKQYYEDHVREGGMDGPKGTLPMLRDRKMQLSEFTSAYGDEVKAVREQGQAPIFDIDSEYNYEVDGRTIDDIDKERE